MSTFGLSAVLEGCKYKQSSASKPQDSWGCNFNGNLQSMITELKDDTVLYTGSKACKAKPARCSHLLD